MERKQWDVGTEKNRLNVVFDLDGVLIDSLNVQKSAFYGSYKEVVGDGKVPSFSEFLKHTGNSLSNIFIKMDLPLKMIEPYRRISREAVDQIVVNQEAMDLIRKLRVYGVKCAVCTGKDHARTVEILNYFGVRNLFDALVCSDDVEEPKPSAVPVLKALEMMGEGVEPGNTIVVGDGYYDILSARNAGCRVVLTLWYGDAGVPREADYVVETVGELGALLMEMLQQSS